MPKSEAPLLQLQSYLPQGSFDDVLLYLQQYKVQLTITRQRQSILGDYRHAHAGKSHRITRTTGEAKLLFDDEEITLPKYSQQLEELGAFSMPAKSIPYLTFRSVLSFFLRPKSGSYVRYDRPQPEWKDYQSVLCQSFLLGIDYHRAVQKHDQKKRLDDQLSLADRYKKDKDLREFYLGEKNAEVELLELETKIKQLEADPWTTVAQRYAVGSVVEGRVRKLTDFGAFIEIEEGIDGLVHVSDLSWTKRIKHPSELLKKGQLVQAVIINIDAPSRRLSLGVKQLQPDAWESFFQAHAVGDTVRGRVCRGANFGVFVEVAPGVEGLCHNSELQGTPRAETGLPVNEEFDFKIIRLNPADKKIGLSLRAISDDEEKTRLDDYHKQAAAATSTIEEAMKGKDS